MNESSYLRDQDIKTEQIRSDRTQHRSLYPCSLQFSTFSSNCNMKLYYNTSIWGGGAILKKVLKCFFKVLTYN